MSFKSLNVISNIKILFNTDFMLKNSVCYYINGIKRTSS